MILDTLSVEPSNIGDCTFGNISLVFSWNFTAYNEDTYQVSVDVYDYYALQIVGDEESTYVPSRDEMNAITEAVAQYISDNIGLFDLDGWLEDQKDWFKNGINED